MCFIIDFEMLKPLSILLNGVLFIGNHEEKAECEKQESRRDNGCPRVCSGKNHPQKSQRGKS